MRYKSTRTGISRQDLAQDRTFWRDLLGRRTSSCGLPPHSAGGYRNRRFAIIRDAASNSFVPGNSRLHKWACSSLHRPCRRGILHAGRSRPCGDRAAAAGGDRSGRSDGMGRLPPAWDDRYRGYPGGPAALERPCGRTAYCVDASGLRRVVELFRVPGRRSGGGKCLSCEAGEACPCEGRARRAERLSQEADQRAWASAPFVSSSPGGFASAVLSESGRCVIRADPPGMRPCRPQAI